jgi:hypothetical protein
VWTKLDIPGALGRWDSPMAVLGGTIVLFGGIGGPEGKVLGDMWTFDSAAWTELRIPGPSKRAGAAFAAP